MSVLEVQERDIQTQLDEEQESVEGFSDEQLHQSAQKTGTQYSAFQTWLTSQESRDLVWFPPFFLPDYMSCFPMSRNPPNATEMLQMLSQWRVLRDGSTLQ